MTTQVITADANGSINQAVDEQGNALIILKHSCAQAKLSLHGGQLLSWQPQGQQEVLWLSKQAQYGENSAIRGGIPICWPWFGANFDQQGINGGNHGFARNLLWQLVDSQITESQITVILELSGQQLHRLWPQAFKLRQQISIGHSLMQTLSLTNLSDEEVRFTSALHSYFAVSDPAFVQVPELANVEFDDKLTQAQAQQQKIANCVGPIDRIYYNAQTQWLIDSKWQRKITIESHNCHQWVLWNPGAEIAQQMADVHLNGEQEFVCLEAANTQWQTIAAGETVSIGQHISVEAFQ